MRNNFKFYTNFIDRYWSEFTLFTIYALALLSGSQFFN